MMAEGVTEFGEATRQVVAAASLELADESDRVPGEEFVELIWWLAARSDLPAPRGEHTEDTGGQCAGYAGYGLPRPWPCAVRGTLGVALAPRASDLFTIMTGRPQASGRR